MKIDFFARRVHFIDHMAPVWKELCAEAKGAFYVPESIIDHAQKRGVEAVPLKARNRDAMDVFLPKGGNVVMVCAYGDLSLAHRSGSKKIVFMEHGVGITYVGHPGYAGGRGLRSKVDLFLAPNEYVRAKTELALPGVKQVVIGTPKLDKWAKPSHLANSGSNVVCISFHWNGERVAPEAGNAYKHYRSALPELASSKDFKLIGHAHPRAMEHFAKIYQELGIEVVRDFEEVMERAHVYVCDNSSTIYEFCVTRRPVIVLNAPWYRRNVHHGIRFWSHLQMAQQLDGPERLYPAIMRELKLPEVYVKERHDVVRELFPYLGKSSQVAARVLEGWLDVS